MSLIVCSLISLFYPDMSTFLRIVFNTSNIFPQLKGEGGGGGGTGVPVASARVGLRLLGPAGAPVRQQSMDLAGPPVWAEGGERESQISASGSRIEHYMPQFKISQDPSARWWPSLRPAGECGLGLRIPQN